MESKRGQFYLIAAIIIIAILISIASVGNFAFTRGSKESVKLYELSQDLQLEGESVINHGIFNDNILNDQLLRFTEDYGEYISKGDSDIYFIYGDKNGLNVRGYLTKDVGTVGLNIGGSPADLTIQGNIVTRDDISVETDPESGRILKPNVVIDVGGKSYPFELKRGENFFFVITQPIGSGDIEIGASNVN